MSVNTEEVWRFWYVYSCNWSWKASRYSKCIHVKKNTQVYSWTFCVRNCLKSRSGTNHCPANNYHCLYLAQISPVAKQALTYLQVREGKTLPACSAGLLRLHLLVCQKEQQLVAASGAKVISPARKTRNYFFLCSSCSSVPQHVLPTGPVVNFEWEIISGFCRSFFCHTKASMLNWHDF